MDGFVGRIVYTSYPGNGTALPEDDPVGKREGGGVLVDRTEARVYMLEMEVERLKVLIQGLIEKP